MENTTLITAAGTYVIDATAQTLTFTTNDGTVTVLGVLNTVLPTDVEVDIVLSDGTTKKFVPA